MPPENRNLAHILDIVIAINAVNDFVAGLTLDDFLTMDMVKSAVKWQFIIMGEATNRLGETFIDERPHIPWHQMRGMRNRLAHEYDSIGDETLWDIIQNDLAPLLEQLVVLLPQNPDDSPS